MPIDQREVKEQLNRIEAKLDNHLERIAKVETSLGGVKLTISLIISFLGASLLAVKDIILKG